MWFVLFLQYSTLLQIAGSVLYGLVNYRAFGSSWYVFQVRADHANLGHLQDAK